MTNQLILIVSGLVSLGAVLGILWLALRPSRGMESRMASLSAKETGSRSGSRQHGSRANLSGGSRSRVDSDSTSASSQRLNDRLVQAGLYRRNSVGFFIVVKLVLAASLVVVGIGSALLHWVTLTQGIFFGAVLGLLGTVLPSLWLDSQKKKRQLAINRALPDALDVIVVCLEAGLSLRAAVSRVAKELQPAHPLLAGELLIAEREIQLGCSGGEAIKHFADRFDLEALRSLASVLLQAEKFGASIAQALRVHAEGLRVKRFQAAEEMAHKASVKLLFPTMFCIFPTLYVVLIGPAVFDIIGFFKTMGQ